MFAKKPIVQIVKTIILLFTLVYFHTGHTAGFESSERMNNTVRSFLVKNIQTEPGESIEIKVNQSNTPLRVSACSREVEAAFPENSNQEQLTAIALSCNDSTPWHILVPVEVQIFSKVIIAKRTIVSKESITEDDLDFTVYNKNHLYNGFFTSKEEVTGSQAVRIIPAGTVLTKKSVRLPLLVQRNQTINLVSQSNSILVTMQGIARSDGSLNSVIKVFNPSSKKTLDAVVTGPNTARVVA